MTTVFISYSSEDAVFAERLANDLKASHYDVWFDKWSIKIGDVIPSEIERGLINADFFIIVLSNNSINSKWVDTELKLKYMKDIDGKKSTLLPVKIDNCEPPFLLSNKKYADFFSSYNNGFSELLARLNESHHPIYNDIFEITLKDGFSSKILADDLIVAAKNGYSNIRIIFDYQVYLSVVSQLSLLRNAIYDASRIISIICDNIVNLHIEGIDKTEVVTYFKRLPLPNNFKIH